MTFMMPSMMLIMNGISVLIVYNGSYAVDAGNMQVGDMMAFIQYAMQIIMAFLMITAMSIMLPRANAVSYTHLVTFLCIAFLDLKLLLKSWKLSVLKLCSLFQVIALLCLLYLLIHILDLLTKLLKFFYRMLFIVPLSLLSIKFIPKISKLLLKVSKTLLT